MLYCYVMLYMLFLVTCVFTLISSYILVFQYCVLSLNVVFHAIIFFITDADHSSGGDWKLHMMTPYLLLMTFMPHGVQALQH